MLVEVNVTFVFPSEMVMLFNDAAASTGSLTVNGIAAEVVVDCTVWLAMLVMLGGRVPAVSG